MRRVLTILGFTVLLMSVAMVSAQSEPPQSVEPQGRPTIQDYTPTSTATETVTGTATSTATSTATATLTSTPDNRRQLLPLVVRQLPTPTATPLPTVPPEPSVSVQSYTTYHSGSTLYIVGEVLNTTSGNAFAITVVASLYDAAGQLIAVDDSYVMRWRVGPGETGPFKISVTNAPTNVARITFGGEWSSRSYFPTPPVTVVSSAIRNNSGVEVFGIVRNDQGTQLTSVKIVVTFYDAFGKVVEADSGYASVSTLAPGAESPYRISTYRTFSYVRFIVQAEGDS